MRAINIFILLAFIFLNACSSIEVAEVVTKTSIKVAENVAKSAKKISGDDKINQENTNLETTMATPNDPFKTGGILPTETMPTGIANVVNRDYRGLMKAIEKKKGR